MEAPENTLPAYIKAWEQGVDAVELDIRETKDKRLICIHDDSLARVSESEYTISQETLAALKTVDVGSSRSKKFANTSIPLLKEAFDCKPDKSKIFVEIKPSKSPAKSETKNISSSSMFPNKLNVSLSPIFPPAKNGIVKIPISP